MLYEIMMMSDDDVHLFLKKFRFKSESLVGIIVVDNDVSRPPIVDHFFGQRVFVVVVRGGS